MIRDLINTIKSCRTDADASEKKAERINLTIAAIIGFIALVAVIIYCVTVLPGCPLIDRILVPIEAIICVPLIQIISLMIGRLIAAQVL